MKILETISVRSQSLPTFNGIDNSSLPVSFNTRKSDETKGTQISSNEIINNKSSKLFFISQPQISTDSVYLKNQHNPEMFNRLTEQINRNKIELDQNEKSTTKLLSQSKLHENFSLPIAERGRMMASKPNETRLVEKSGESNITLVNVTKRKRKFMVDFMTTIMELKWRYHVLLFLICFALSWVLFGLAWYIVAWVNGDFDPLKTDVCVINVKDFSSAFLFSIETQATIGYGYRYINSDCAFGIFLIMLQSCFGIFITCFATGIIFGKISRPKRRSQTIMFSKNAVICKRESKYYFQFRVGDMRKTHIIGTSIRAIFVRQRKTNDNEIIPLCQYPLEIETETSKLDSFIFFLWPVTISHKIDRTSPFWEMSAEDIVLSHFEVVVILEGTVPTNGALIQVRTSYISSEIRWGQTLTPLITVETYDGDCVIDYSKFHDTSPIVMMECSASEYSMRKHLGTSDEWEDFTFPASFSAPAVRLHEMSPKFLKAIGNGLLSKHPMDHKKSKKKNKNSQKIHNPKMRSRINIEKSIPLERETCQMNEKGIDLGTNLGKTSEITYV